MIDVVLLIGRLLFVALLYLFLFAIMRTGIGLVRGQRRKEKTWNLSSEKTIYQFEDGQLLSTNSLQRNNQGEYQSVEHTIIMNPYEDQLLAGK